MLLLLRLTVASLLILALSPGVNGVPRGGYAVRASAGMEYGDNE